MKTILVLGVLLTAACGGIKTGDVGVRSSFFGRVSMEEEQPGFYTALFDSVREYSAKEIAVELEDMTPKARDNLSLKDMDVTVYYRVDAAQIAELVVKYAGQSRETDGIWLPGYILVQNIAHGVAYDEVARVDSLKMHTQRDELSLAIKNALQEQLNAAGTGVFTITRVVIRSVLTDPSIEQSIQNAIARQKELEAMSTKVEIAGKEAEVKVAEAKGIAEANHIINTSLTREYLQHEQNQALMKFAEGHNSTVVIPSSMTSAAPLINVGSK